MAKISRRIGINWIVALFYNPCDPVAWIYLEIAFPALILAIWNYIYPGWKDIIQYATGKSWLKHTKQNLGAQAVEEPTWRGKGVRFLLEAAEELDKRAWQFMVFEVLYDAYLLWHSVLKDLGPCDRAALDGNGYSKLPIDGRPTNYDWQIGPLYLTQRGTIRPYVGQTLTIPAGGWGYWTGVNRYEAFLSGAPLRVRERYRVVETGQILSSYEPPEEITDPKEANIVHIFYRNPSGSAQTIIQEVQLVEGQTPLVWYCANGFCSQGYAAQGEFRVPGRLALDVQQFKGVRNRHSLQYGKSYKRKKQSETDINER